MRPKRDRNSKIAEQILARRTLARGVVVLDKGLMGLEPALREANILVVKPRPGWSLADIKEWLLLHRIIITRDPRKFVHDAAVYEYGIIALDRLGSIDFSPSYRSNKTVRLVSQAMTRYKLWPEGAKFLLEIRADGKHHLQELG